MRVYAESSAVLAWLLEGPECDAVNRTLVAADGVASSRLTLLECERALLRGTHTGRLNPADAYRARRALAVAAARWTIVDLGIEILEQAKRVFPREVVRSLDAIHLATLILLQPAMLDLQVLSLDRRIVENAELLGFTVLPAG